MKYTIDKTDAFDEWLRRLSDRHAKIVIATRLDRVATGNLGDYKMFDGLIELRIFYGPGYRLYGAVRDGAIVVLFVGGDKGSQTRDIATAKKMLQERILQEAKDEDKPV